MVERRKKCVIVDLDGTLADNNHRVHHIRKTPKDWNAFNAACVDDTCHTYLAELIEVLGGRYYVFICSGRSGTYAVETARWLDKYNIRPYQLMMRSEKDYRPDTVIKREMLDKIRELGFEPVVAIDDRPSVVKMWRENGVPTLVVDDSSWEGEEK